MNHTELISECCHEPIKECTECGDSVCTICNQHCEIIDPVSEPEYLTEEQLKEIKKEEKDFNDHVSQYQQAVL